MHRSIIVDKRNRNRLVFAAIVLVFATPLLTALVLHLSGWRPANTRNYGTLVQPPVDVSGADVRLADGSAFAWRDEQWHWNLLALPNGSCGDECRTRLAEIMRMRITLGRNADRLRVLYLGEPLPAQDLAAATPLQTGTDTANAFARYRPQQPGALALALVDPNGLLMLRWDAGYDAARLRQDIVKVVH
jgi:hypothetical protein